MHAEHLLRCVIQSIDLAAADHRPARWHFRLDGSDYLATQALTALIFAGSDAHIDITGKTAAVQRFRQLVGTMATVVQPV